MPRFDRLLAACVFAASVFAGNLAASAQQLPPGTHSVDDPGAQAAGDRLRAAEKALEEQDFAGAAKLLAALAQERPQDAHVLYDLGFAQERLGDDDRAASSYRAALAAAGASAAASEPRLALGLLDARHNRLQEAHGELAAAAATTTAAPDLRARAFRALARLDVATHPGEAAQDILQAIALTGETPGDTALSGEAALRAGDLAGAERQLVKALAAEPANVETRLDLAVALRQEGKLADAESTLRAGLADSAGDTRLVAQLADILAREGKTGEAIALLEKLRNDDPAARNDVDLTAMLARVESLAGRDAEAEPLLRSVLAGQPHNPGTLDELGSVLVRQQKYAEAQQVLRQAVRDRAAFHDDRAWAEAASHLAFAAQKNGQPELALQALAARATVLPESAASLFLEATAHDALHHTSDARRLYRSFLSASAGKFPDEETEARHRLIALDHAK